MGFTAVGAAPVAPLEGCDRLPALLPALVDLALSAAGGGCIVAQASPPALPAGGRTTSGSTFKVPVDPLQAGRDGLSSLTTLADGGLAAAGSGCCVAPASAPVLAAGIRAAEDSSCLPVCFAPASAALVAPLEGCGRLSTVPALATGGLPAAASGCIVAPAPPATLADGVRAATGRAVVVSVAHPAGAAPVVTLAGRGILSALTALAAMLG